MYNDPTSVGTIITASSSYSSVILANIITPADVLAFPTVNSPTHKTPPTPALHSTILALPSGLGRSRRTLPITPLLSSTFTLPIDPDIYQAALIEYAIEHIINAPLPTTATQHPLQTPPLQTVQSSSTSNPHQHLSAPLPTSTTQHSTSPTQTHQSFHLLPYQETLRCHANINSTQLQTTSLGHAQPGRSNLSFATPHPLKLSR